MTRSTRRWALISQIATSAYLQLIEWIPMPPWNDLSRGNGQATLDAILAAVGLLFIGAAARRAWRLTALAAISYAVWLVLQIQTWWIPYFAGASPGWSRVYAQWFSGTWKFLPPIGNHPIPDAAHVVLHALLIATVLTSARAAWRWRKENRKTIADQE